MTRARGLDRALPLDPERVVVALADGPATVQGIASVLRVRPRAVWARLRALEAAGRVRRAGVVRGRGRPAVLWGGGPMSATNRGAVRRDRDAYYTPDDLADAIVRHIVAPHLHDFGRVVEPHVGGGAFARAVRKTRTLQHVTGFDLAPTPAAWSACDIVHRGDWLADPDTDTGRARDALRADVVVGNPPFGGWERHAEVAFGVAPVVVFLLRLSVLEGGARASWWAKHRPAEVWTLAERPSFTSGGNDSAAYGVMVWRRGHTGPTSLHLLSWRATRDRPALGVVW